MDIYVGGRASRHLEYFPEICSVFWREVVGVGEKESLGIVVVSEPLENGATEPMDLVLGNGPGGIDTWEATFRDGVEFRCIAPGGFVGSACGQLGGGGLASEVEHARRFGGGVGSGG